jgi:RluA family pseudouridine synthase
MNIKKYITYEDSDIIAVNKPCGLLTIPDGYDPTKPNIHDLLKDRYENVYNVHRLDKVTSGILVFAKNAEAHRHLNLLFMERRIHKVYIALAYGSPIWENVMVNLPLRINGDRRHRTVIDKNHGKAAQTAIRVIQRNNTYFSCEILPKTGYTHQIRAHLSIYGHPVIGDSLYTRLKSINKKEKLLIKNENIFLHAFSIDLSAFFGKSVKLQAKLPQYFVERDSKLSDY